MSAAPRRRGRWRPLLISAGSNPSTAGGLSVASPASAAPSHATATQLIATGLKPGAIKHVWLIILENKSYDATFTGLNQNTYLWKTLPAQGALLTHYYGTGHSSMDNYLSMVSGQAPSEDVQEDCSTSDTLINTDSGIETGGGSLSRNPTTASSSPRAVPTHRWGAMGARSRPMCRPCSTSSMQQV